MTSRTTTEVLKWRKCSLKVDEIKRYSRQLLVRDIGVLGQERLLAARVLIVGAGGLGCPIASYLAGAGIGTLGVIDFDVVEESNLHRQILHRTEDALSVLKAQSIKRAVTSINPSITCNVYCEKFSKHNATSLVAQYDVIVDATDNLETRYLINKEAVLSAKPIVSGNALGLEGSLSVYNFQNGPCLACVYPPNVASGRARSCSDNGVLGMVPGVIGTLQAAEVVKIITGTGKSLVGRSCMYDAFDGTFREFKLPKKRPDCLTCGNIKSDVSVKNTMSTTNLSDFSTILPIEFNKKAMTSQKMLLLDVREKVQFDICSLEGFINIPLSEFNVDLQSKNLFAKRKEVFVICRRGNDSKVAATLLTRYFKSKMVVFHIQGGLEEWQRTVDETFPVY